MKKEVKKMKTGWIVFLIIVTCMFQLRNCFYTEDDLKWVAQRSLKKKYGEEFVIYRVWDKSQEMFFATCSPKDDPEVVFEGYFNKNGDDGGVIKDGYAQGVVAKEIDQILRDDFQELFGNCYTKASVFNYYSAPNFEDVKELTLEEYLSQVNVDFVGYDVFVPLTEITDNCIEKEYEMFAGKIQDEVKNGIIPDVVVDLYFVDEEMLKKCKEHYETRTKISDSFSDELDQYLQVYFAYPEGSINKTYEEYEEARKGIVLNE